MTNSSPLSYPIMEHFYTIQGEGNYTGTAAYFIRLGGCDVGCVWCDVKESWDAGKHPHMSVDELVSVVNEHPGNLVVRSDESCECVKSERKNSCH
jgi:organic radical activating enzyme